MPRVNGIMQPIPNAYGTPDTPILSAKYNSQLDDLIADANAARPVTAGGTGSQSAEGAREALGITTAISTAISTAITTLSDTLKALMVKKAGDRMTGSLSSAVKDHGTLATVTEEFKYADGNTHKVVCNGALTINPTGLAEGDVMQINVTYTAGSIAVSGTTQWELGAGQKSADIAAVGVTLVAGAGYRLIFEMVGGVRTGVLQ